MGWKDVSKEEIKNNSIFFYFIFYFNAKSHIFLILFII